MQEWVYLIIKPATLIKNGFRYYLAAKSIRLSN